MRNVHASLVTLLCLTIAACSQDNTLGPWQEEVELTDGRVLVVERFEDMEVHRRLGDAGAAFINSTTISPVEPTHLVTL